MTTPNQRQYGYLTPALEVMFPSDPAEFRAIYQQPNPAAPEYRLEGLASMTDGDITKLAETLQLAAIEAPEKINDLWSAVCTQGWLVSRGVSA